MSVRSWLVPAALLAHLSISGAAAQSPEILLGDERALADPAALPLLKGRSSVVHRGVAGESGFNLHSYLAVHDGKLWAMWSSSRADEEDPDQRLLFASSRDGHQWSPAGVLAPDPDGPEGPLRWIARGLLVDQGRLKALGALVASAAYGQRGKNVVWQDLKLIEFEWTGREWRRLGVYADDCMNNFAPSPLGGRLFMVCRDRNMDVSAAWREAPGRWRHLALDKRPPFDRMDEPAWYQSPDGVVHMLIRDGRRSRRLLRAISRDGGETWSTPVVTNYPDATSKTYTGQLANGAYYLISNPNPAGRDPLAISFSRDGWTFSSPAAIRRQAPPRRLHPDANTRGSLQYPHAIEWKKSLWVIYSTNKEDIEITELPRRVLPAAAR